MQAWEPLTTVPSPVGRALADLSLNSSPSKLTGSLPKQSSWSPSGDTGQLPSWSSEGCQTQVLLAFSQSKGWTRPCHAPLQGSILNSILGRHCFQPWTKALLRWDTDYIGEQVIWTGMGARHGAHLISGQDWEPKNRKQAWKFPKRSSLRLDSSSKVSLCGLLQSLWTWVLRFQGCSSLYPVCCPHALTVQWVLRFHHPEAFPQPGF